MVIKKARAKKAQEKAQPTTRHYGVLLGPIITEKASSSSNQGDRIIFRVERRASKDEIRTAIERVFGVKVAAINTVNVLGKVKRTNKSVGRRAAFKKAYITLAEGQKIDIVEGL